MQFHTGQPRGGTHPKGPKRVQEFSVFWGNSYMYNIVCAYRKWDQKKTLYFLVEFLLEAWSIVETSTAELYQYPWGSIIVCEWDNVAILWWIIKINNLKHYINKYFWIVMATSIPSISKNMKYSNFHSITWCFKRPNEVVLKLDEIHYPDP